MERVNIRIGPVVFDHANYDAEHDVLYLHIGEPSRGEGEETPEGHVIRYAPRTQRIVGLTMITPLVLALFAHAVPGDSGLSALHALRAKSHSPTQLLLVIIIGGCLSGSAGAVREIVKERPIFSRERATAIMSRLESMPTPRRYRSARSSSMRPVPVPRSNNTSTRFSPVTSRIAASTAASGTCRARNWSQLGATLAK